MKREIIYRTDALAAVGNLKGLSATDKIKAMGAVLCVPGIICCQDCKYQDRGSNESESWNLCRYRPWLHVPTEDEHYCGYAERRQHGSD